MRHTYKSPWGWIVVPALGLVELGMGLVGQARTPRTQAYDALPSVVSELAEPGDLIVVSPRWAEPEVRRALGDRWFPLSVAAHNDAGRFGRALEISLGSRAEELAGFREVRSREAGPFSLRVLENPSPHPVLFDFVEHLEPRWAAAYGTAPESRCAWSDHAETGSGGLGGVPGFPVRRFECAEGFYLNVSATVIADQDFLPRRCIYAHPPPTGARVVRFVDVPLGERIEGHLGLYWMIERARRGAPITLSVRVGQEELGSVTHADGEGWKPFSFATGAHAGELGAEVSFTVASADYKDRHLCFEAVSR